MATLDQEFDATAIPEDDRNFDPIPAGNYLMQVIDSEVKPTKSGTGDQLVLTLEVIDGRHSGRRVWDRLNIRNQNPDAQRIAQRALADLMLAIGVRHLVDTEELHFKPFTGKVTIKPDKTGEFGPQNAVRYKPSGGSPAQPPTSSAAAPGAGARSTNTAQAQNATTARSASHSNGGRPWAK